jgi:membrane-bound metal-dependent hydrolase YbcI (DUF457 family)
MPQAVTHVIISLVLMSIIRDFYIRKKGRKSFPLHYVLIAGIAGLLPDLDIVVFWGLSFFGFSLNEVHRTFTHTLFVPLLFLLLAFVTSRIKIRELGRHKLKLSTIFLMIAFGSFTHLLLDATLAGQVSLFYPLISARIGLNLISYLPSALQNLAMPSLDALILVLWLVYMEMRHRISDFI